MTSEQRMIEELFGMVKRLEQEKIALAAENQRLAEQQVELYNRAYASGWYAREHQRDYDPVDRDAKRCAALAPDRAKQEELREIAKAQAREAEK